MNNSEKGLYCFDVPMDYVRVAVSQWNFLMLLGAHYPFAFNYHELTQSDRLAVAIVSDWKVKNRPNFQDSAKCFYLFPKDSGAACTLEAYFDDFFKWIDRFHQSPGWLVHIDFDQYPKDAASALMKGAIALNDYPRDWDVQLATVEQTKSFLRDVEGSEKNTAKPRSLGFGKAQQWVYFVEMVGQGKVKIGTTGNVNARLAQLQTSSPYQLKLLAVIDGSNATEKQYHKRFERYRVSGEWYDLSGDFEKFIKGLLCIQD